MGYIYKDKKSGRWSISISVKAAGEKKATRYRFSTGTSDQTLARRALKKIERLAFEGRFFEPVAPAKPPPPTFNGMIERFEEDYVVRMASARGVKAGLKVIKATLQKLTKSKNPLLSEINTDTLIQAKKIWFVEGKAPATVNRYLSALKKAYNYVIDVLDWDIKNPVKKFLTEIEDNERNRVLSLEEEERLLSACGPFIRDLIIFALNTGLREGKICSLTWDQINLPEMTATFPKDKVRWDKKNKTRPMTIPLNQTVVDVLQRRFSEKSASQYIFASREGAKMTDSNVWQRFHHACVKAGIEGLRFHDLRHTFNTRLEEMHISQQERMKLLGQTTPRINDRYSHADVETYRGAVNAIEEWKKERKAVPASLSENLAGSNHLGLICPP